MLMGDWTANVSPWLALPLKLQLRVSNPFHSEYVVDSRPVNLQLLSYLSYTWQDSLPPLP